MKDHFCLEAKQMIMWIILGYLAASVVASLLFYAACIVAARADKFQQHGLITPRLHEIASEVADKRTEHVAAPRLALNA
jgi:hypothetical protein